MNSAGDAFIPHIGWLSHEPGDELISLLRQGYFEAAEQAFFWLYLRPDDWFFDCGAHIGLYSVLASRATTGQSHIFCVEASPTTADYLERNLMRNEVHGARVFRRALWKDSGVVPFVSEGPGQSAYAHVAKEGGGQNKTVQAITLDELVSLSEAGEISLVKIDVEGAEPEALQGARVAAATRSLPVIMIEFTERNLQRRGASSDQLAKQFYQLGYELCEFSSETLELVPYRLDGPIWYKNLFACFDRNSVNLRLKSAVSRNRNIAMDILERGSACSRFKELEELESYRSRADKVQEFQQWAEKTERMLTEERSASAQLRAWAEKTEKLLIAEKQNSESLRAWAEKTENLLAAEKQNSEGLRAWAESTEATLAREKGDASALREQCVLLETQVKHYEEMTLLSRLKELFRYCVGRHSK